MMINYENALMNKSFLLAQDAIFSNTGSFHLNVTLRYDITFRQASKLLVEVRWPLQ